ncbi:lantibiotic dehydratase [Streptomyces sp. NPDC014734]|uniref:lantibiotic dehydratase n=1 Tax=Streptomyces sp. NPDC014734 TaxID=3364886 RepID=UPI0037013092
MTTQYPVLPPASQTAPRPGPSGDPVPSVETVEPLWILRINPLRRKRLGDAALRPLLARLADAERTVRESARLCSDELYELIGATDDEETRRRIVALRRTIHNDRTPKFAAPAPGPAVAQWLAARNNRAALREEVAHAYAPAADRERGTLADLLDDEDLNRSLALVSPEVYEESRRYRSAVAAGASLSARARKSERGLIQYVTRAMVRTSPLARFTAVGIAVPDPGGLSPENPRFTSAVPFAGLDRVMLAYVLGGLNPPVGAQLLEAWVGMSPTSALEPDGSKLFFLRPTETGYQRLAIPVKGTLQALVDATVMGPRPVRSVVAHIAAQAGCSPQDAAKVVMGGVHQGILCTYNEAEDGAVELSATLDRPSTPAAHLLGDVRDRLARLGATPAADRGAELATIRDDFAQVSGIARRPAQITVEEDFVLSPARVASQHWQKPLADLGPVVELLSVFDWLHDVRVVTTAAFVQRFGAGANIPLAEHAESLVKEVSRRAAVMGEVYLEGNVGALTGLGTDDGSLEQLHALRRRIVEATEHRIGAAADEGGQEVSFSTEEANELTGELPERLRRDPLSYGVLTQSAGDGRLVFNDGLPGHGMLYARFLDADRRLGGDALARLAERLTARYGWDGSRVVEDLGLHRLNVNAHPRILPDGLRPDDWYALRLVHDKGTDQLRVEDADGRALRILPLGTGHPGLFPPPLSLASCLATGGRLNNDLLDGWHRSLAWDQRTTRVAPRISVGEVVLARRRWYGGEELEAALNSGGAEHERLAALTEWRGRYDVPEEVVVKTALEQVSPRTLDPADVMPRRRQLKPQYVDLACALGTRVLPRMLERRATDVGTVNYLEEALPGVTDGTHASEWIVEIGRKPGGLFHYEGDFGS